MLPTVCQVKTDESNNMRVITYIDGFNLYFGLREKGWRKYMWLDLVKFSSKLLANHEKLVHTHYFTSRVRGSPGKERRQTLYLDALETLPGLTKHFGKYQTNPVTCPKCKFVHLSPQEKQTDVNIATQMMTDALQDVFDKAILVTADSDLAPPLRALRTLFGGKKHVLIALPPGRDSVQLKQHSTASIQLHAKHFHDCLLPLEVNTSSGYVIACPLKWRP